MNTATMTSAPATSPAPPAVGDDPVPCPLCAKEGCAREARCGGEKFGVVAKIVGNSRQPPRGVASLKGAEHPSWRGGRSIDSDGYVLIRVGTDHHLSDVRGYAYEHRMVAGEMLGRRLVPGEQVHHVNRVRTDNRPENLKVCASAAEHFAEHRKPDCKRMKIGEDNPLIFCKCGCGEQFLKYGNFGRPRKFAPVHSVARLTHRLSVEAMPCASCGTKGGYIPKGCKKPTRCDGSKWGLGFLCSTCASRLWKRDRGRLSSRAVGDIDETIPPMECQ